MKVDKLSVKGRDLLYDGFDIKLSWRGRPIWKNPVDLVTYQMIAREVRPNIVIETGTHLGGSAEFWSEMMQGRGIVITIDVDKRCTWGDSAGIIALEGSSTDPEVVSKVGAMVVSSDVVLVNLDSLHWGGHVLAELRAYSPFVTVGSYLIVEDGIDDFRYGTVGPHQVCAEWVEKNPGFVIDESWEQPGWTNCPGGFLRRVS